MGRPFLAAALVVGMVLLYLSAAAAEPRVALVIGNSAYRDTPLANPTNDARLIAKTLSDLGFELIVRVDVEQKAMKLAILEFDDRLEAAGKDAVGLFFYAGHGVQVRGRNFLVPLNSRIQREKDVAVEAINVAWVLEQMEFAGNRVNFVILDACRNNPLTRSFRSPTRGLARMNAPRGSFIAYSTAPGNVALEGTGVNSPYTLALAKTMYRPGVPAERLFKLVRDLVITETKGQQTPWEESSLTGEDFYFAVPTAQTALTPTPAPTRAETTVRLEQETVRMGQETVFWQSVKDSPDPEDFQDYLTQYPKGVFSGLAKRRVRALTKVAALTPPAAAASTPSAGKDVPVHEWDEAWYKVRGNQEGGTAGNVHDVGPRGKLSDMQKTEWIAGTIVGAAEVCEYYGKSNEIHIFMNKSPYFKKGYDRVKGLTGDAYFGISSCEKYLAPLKQIIEQKDRWWNYLTAAYPN